MMTNLFSTFDPATWMQFSMNWMSGFIMFIILPMPYWVMPNKSIMMANKITNKLHNEFKLLLKSESSSNTLIMITMFMFILINNSMGLLPYIFTSSSHLVFSLTYGLDYMYTCCMYVH